MAALWPEESRTPLFGDLLVILLTGGTKQRQNRDIEAAKDYWADYKRRRPRAR